MKKNLYYQHVFKRTNVIKVFIIAIFIAAASLPRLLLEVFIRKNFGERYFSLVQAIILAIFLFFAPVFLGKMQGYGAYGGFSIGSIITHDPTWFLFLTLFIIMAIRRQYEIRRLPSVFDFSRFSLSNGIINPRFYQIKLFGKTPNTRTISILYEPGFFLLIGIILSLSRQSVGLLIIVSSVFYSLGYYGAFYIGDEFIMDKIDELICNEELINSFVDEEEPVNTRGFYAYGRGPANPEMRRKVVDSFFEEEETANVT